MTEPLIVSRFHRTTIPVDGCSIRVHVNRLNVEQLAEFGRDLAVHDTPATERRIAVRLPGDELARRPGADGAEGEFVIPDHEIQSRRLSEMTAEDRAAWTQAHACDTAAAAEFLRRAARYVHLEPGQVKAENPDGSLRDVTEAVDLLELFGSPALGRAVIAAVWTENHLPSAAKNVFRSLLDSGGSSVGLDLGAAGSAPEATAANAGKRGSATSAGVMAAHATRPSGSKATSRSTRARSSSSRPRSSTPSGGSR